MASWIRKVLEFIKKNAECVFTLAGVLIYMALRGIADVFHLGFVLWLLAAGLTVVGVLSTMHSDKSRQDKSMAYITHAAIWILRGVLSWIAGIAVICYLINRFTNGGMQRRIEQEQEDKRITVHELPAWLYSVGGITYSRMRSDDWSVEYANRDNPNDRVIITKILNYTGDAVDTNAGYFYMRSPVQM